MTIAGACLAAQAMRLAAGDCRRPGRAGGPAMLLRIEEFGEAGVVRSSAQDSVQVAVMRYASARAPCPVPILPTARRFPSVRALSRRSLKALIGANVAVFFAQMIFPVSDRCVRAATCFVIRDLLDLAARHLHVPSRRHLSHPVQHAGAVDVRSRARTRLWGTQYFLRFYFVTGIGAGILTVLFSLLPFDAAQQVHLLQRHRRVRARFTGCCSRTGCISRSGRSTCTWSSRFQRRSSSQSWARSRLLSRSARRRRHCQRHTSGRSAGGVP